jgi:hypothetical protein
MFVLFKKNFFKKWIFICGILSKINKISKQKCFRYDILDSVLRNMNSHISHLKPF